MTKRQTEAGDVAEVKEGQDVAGEQDVAEEEAAE